MVQWFIGSILSLVSMYSENVFAYGSVTLLPYISTILDYSGTPPTADFGDAVGKTPSSSYRPLVQHLQPLPTPNTRHPPPSSPFPGLRGWTGDKPWMRLLLQVVSQLCARWVGPAARTFWGMRIVRKYLAISLILLPIFMLTSAFSKEVHHKLLVQYLTWWWHIRALWI